MPRAGRRGSPRASRGPPRQDPPSARSRSLARQAPRGKPLGMRAQPIGKRLGNGQLKSILKPQPLPARVTTERARHEISRPSAALDVHARDIVSGEDRGQRIPSLNGAVPACAHAGLVYVLKDLAHVSMRIAPVAAEGHAPAALVTARSTWLLSSVPSNEAPSSRVPRAA